MSEMHRLCPIAVPLPAVACYRKVLHLWFISAFFGSSLHFFPEKRAGNFLSWVRQKSSQSLTSNVAGKKDSSQLSVFRKGSFQLWAVSGQLLAKSYQLPVFGSKFLVFYPLSIVGESTQSCWGQRYFQTPRIRGVWNLDYGVIPRCRETQ